MYLFLRGAADLMWHAMWFAPNETAAIVAARTAYWYEVPLPLLVVALIHLIDAPPRPSPIRRAALGLAFVLTLAFAAATFGWPEQFLVGVRPGARWTPILGPRSTWYAHTYFLIQTLAVLACARVASSPARTAIARRQAALVGLSFAILAAHTGSYALWGFTANALQATPFATGNVIGLLVLAGTLFGVRSLLPGVGDRTRRALVLIFVVVCTENFVFHAWAHASTAWGFPPRPWWPWWRILFSLLSVSILSVAMVRFGLAGLAATARRRVETLAYASLVGVAIALPAGITIILLGGAHEGVALTLVLALVGVTIAPRPLRALSSATARLLTVDARDDAAVGERVARYLHALDARGATDTSVAALRDELGITPEEHARIAALARERRATPSHEPLLGRYRIERELGRGAFGQALLATDVATGARVVVKRYHSSWAEARAFDEARALTSVKHPRVVPLLAVERVGEETFLVLGYVSGGTLHDLVLRSAPLHPERAIALALDLLEGLAAIHAAGVAHRDLKAANVLIDEDGRAVLADLGSSRLVEPQHAADATLTRTPIIGSFATVPPETLRGRAAGLAGDVYSAGAILYEMLAGQTYVDLDGRSPSELPHVVLHHAPRLPHARVPRAIGAVVARALAKDPSARYADAAQMRAALTAALRAS